MGTGVGLFADMVMGVARGTVSGGRGEVDGRRWRAGKYLYMPVYNISLCVRGIQSIDPFDY